MGQASSYQAPCFRDLPVMCEREPGFLQVPACLQRDRLVSVNAEACILRFKRSTDVAIVMTHRCCQGISCNVCGAVVGKRYATELPRHSLARNNFCLDVNAMSRQVRCCHSFSAILIQSA